MSYFASSSTDNIILKKKASWLNAIYLLFKDLKDF